MDYLPFTFFLPHTSLLPYLWHLLFFYSADLAEIEKCCRYSFTQLYLARIFCLCGFTLGVYLITAFPGAYMNYMGISFLLAAVLPGCSGTFFALLWANHSSDADASLMSIYRFDHLADFQYHLCGFGRLFLRMGQFEMYCY